MKSKHLLFIVLFTLLVSCKKDDDTNDMNPYIPNRVFDTGSLINTSLPQYNDLQFPGNYIILNNNYGINGVVLYYAGGTSYFAHELSDPGHALNGCSLLEVENAIATCTCEDGNSFNVINGQPFDGSQTPYSLIPYFVEVNGSIIRVYNN